MRLFVCDVDDTNKHLQLAVYTEVVNMFLEMCNATNNISQVEFTDLLLNLDHIQITIDSVQQKITSVQQIYAI